MQKDYIAFTKEMKKDYTVLIPNMVEILQNLPGDFFDFIARVDHIHSGVLSLKSRSRILLRSCYSSMTPLASS